MSHDKPKTWTAKADTVEPEPLSGATRPALNRFAQVKRDSDGKLRIDVGVHVLAFAGDDAARVSTLLSNADGKRSLDEIAAATGEPLDDVTEMVQQLYELGALVHTGDAAVPALRFCRHLDAHVKIVQMRMATDVPTLLESLERTRSRRLLLGHLIETWHFVRSAATHIAPAVAGARSEHLRMMFSDYLAGEYWHGQWLKEGLAAAGLDDASLARADPLPGTLALMNLLRHAAGTDLLAYSACLGAGEQEGGEKALERVRRYYDALQRTELLPPEALAPFRAHVEEDCGADHHSFAAEAFAESPPLGPAEQDAIRRTVLSYQRAVGEQRLQIDRFYGPLEGPATWTVD